MVIIQQIFATSFLIWGLSHIVQPKAWVLFFNTLRQLPYGGIIVAMYTLPIGLLLLFTHNTWHLQPSVGITIAAWMMTIKSIIYVLYPQSFTKVIEENPKKELSLKIVGGLMIVFGTVIWIEIICK